MHTANGKVVKSGCLGGEIACGGSSGTLESLPAGERSTERSDGRCFRQGERVTGERDGDIRAEESEVPSLETSTQEWSLGTQVCSHLPTLGPSLASFSLVVRHSLLDSSPLTHALTSSHTPPSRLGWPASVYLKGSIWNPRDAIDLLPQTQDFRNGCSMPPCLKCIAVTGGRGWVARA